MPFTFAHAAAALPFRRTRLITSAVVVGCFAPDFEYFVRLAPRGGLGHTVWGIFALDLPLGWLVFELFHRYAKLPMWSWSPRAVRERIDLDARTPHRGLADIILVLISILIGIATHLLWDSFTDKSFWPYSHWHFLSHTVRVPIADPVQVYKVLQHASTVLGGLIILIWFLRRPTRASVHPQPVVAGRVSQRTLFACACAAALAGGALRAFLGVGIPHGPRSLTLFAAEGVITAVSLFWLELVIVGLLQHRAGSHTKAG